MKKTIHLIIASIIVLASMSLQSFKIAPAASQPNRELFISLGTCQSINENPEYSTATAVAYIFNELGSLDDFSDFYAGGIRVYISRLGQEKAPKITMLELAPAIRNDLTRQKAAMNFMIKVLKTVKRIASKPSDHNVNYLNAGLGYQLSWLNKSRFSKNKSVFILTDGLQTEPIQLDILMLGDDKEQEDFLTISPIVVEMLEEDYPWPNLSDLRFKIANSKKPDNPDRTKVLNQFWAYRLKAAGAKEVWAFSLD